MTTMINKGFTPHHVEHHIPGDKIHQFPTGPAALWRCYTIEPLLIYRPASISIDWHLEWRVAFLRAITDSLILLGEWAVLYLLLSVKATQLVATSWEPASWHGLWQNQKI